MNKCFNKAGSKVYVMNVLNTTTEKQNTQQRYEVPTKLNVKMSRKIL